MGIGNLFGAKRKTEKNRQEEISPFLESKIYFWRRKICDSMFFFFTTIGFLAYVPSVILAYKDDLKGIIYLDSIAYALVLFITLNKRIPYKVQAVAGSAIFYFLGVMLVYLIGPIGVGNLWLLTFSLVVGLTLGEKASLYSLGINILSQFLLAFVISRGWVVHDMVLFVNSEAMLARAINFIVLNIVMVISIIIFFRGFESLMIESNETRKATIIGLAKLAEYRDTDTGEHLHRIRCLTMILAKALRETERYEDYITEDYIWDLSMSSILHDIGKVGIQDEILLKPGKLTELEFKEIKKHPDYGADVIREIEKNIRGRSLYRLGAEVAACHHEKWDGTGYPNRLAGEEIPLSARIVALADVYDALVSKRPYKKAFSHREAVKIIKSERGRHFDPYIADIFLGTVEPLKDQLSEMCRTS